LRQAVVECLGIGPAIDREHELDIGTQEALRHIRERSSEVPP